MKTFDLASAENEGKAFGPCLLRIDEEAKMVEVSKVGGLLRKQVSLGISGYDSKTPFSVSGKTVKLGEFVLVAKDEATAVQIGGIFGAGRATRTEKTLENHVSELLLTRAAELDLLVSYKSNPRKTIFELTASASAGSSMEEYSSRVRNDLSEEIRRIEAVLVPEGTHQEEYQTNKVFAFIYAAGRLQNAVLKTEGVNSAKSLLTEIGIGTSLQSGLSVTDVTNELLRHAKDTVLSPTPQPKPGRSS